MKKLILAALIGAVVTAIAFETWMGLNVPDPLPLPWTNGVDRGILQAPITHPSVI